MKTKLDKIRSIQFFTNIFVERKLASNIDFTINTIDEYSNIID